MVKRAFISGKSEWSYAGAGTVVSASSVCVHSLLQSFDYTCVNGDPVQCEVERVSIDSRNCGEKSLFLAICGSKQDGHDYIEDALKNGCKAILVEAGGYSLQKQADICIIEVADSRLAQALLAEKLFADPSRSLNMIGVTGTNGKTSVTYLLESVLRHAGKQVGVIGTISYRYLDREKKEQVVPSPYTTPEPFLLQSTLRKMADAGVEYVVMEVSSHGIAQHRIGSMQFQTASFTNLSRDHLDFHVDMDTYFREKSKLFTEHLAAGGEAIIGFSKNNQKWSKTLLQQCKAHGIKTHTCGVTGCDISPESVTASVTATTITLQTKDGQCVLRSPLVGEFNVSNIQLTYALAMAAGISQTVIVDALRQATGAPGRMRRVTACPKEEHFRPTVIVDYAHTPDALAQLLNTLKPLVQGNLFCVFGCGGDRDPGKRQLMGEVAGQYADVVIITDDNPRTEDAATIRKMVVEGVTAKGLVKRDVGWLQTEGNNKIGFVEIGDREEAILAAIYNAKAGDIVCLAGKGHEDYQITKEGKRFFDDILVAQKGLSAWCLESLVRATGGTVSGGDGGSEFFHGVSTDSRDIGKNDIFVALQGERFDGHDYLAAVEKAGAGVIIVQQAPTDTVSLPFLLVSDTEQGLGDLAAHRRQCLKHMVQQKVVGITGSSGKTTLKEMCFSIFEQQWPVTYENGTTRVLKTKGNFNNSIGLPLSLLPATPAHKVLLLEMGMNHPGEIRYLTKIADPDIACILNIHGAHLEGLGSIEGVAAAKAELFETSNIDTLFVVNGDDERVLALSKKFSQKKVYFGLDDKQKRGLSVSASNYAKNCGEKVEFTLHIGDKKADVVVNVPGKHNIVNALAAAAIAHAAGVSLSTISRGLSHFTPAANRMQLCAGPFGSRIINDCYNANPESMKAGLATLAGFRNTVRIAVLADMLELGEGAAALHTEIGKYTADLGIEFLAVLGEFAGHVASGAAQSENKRIVVKHFQDQESCAHWVQDILTTKKEKGTPTILVKGSRGMHLENIVTALQEGDWGHIQ